LAGLFTVFGHFMGPGISRNMMMHFGATILLVRPTFALFQDPIFSVEAEISVDFWAPLAADPNGSFFRHLAGQIGISPSGR
jgi:hypothetical protein